MAKDGYKKTATPEAASVPKTCGFDDEMLDKLLDALAERAKTRKSSAAPAAATPAAPATPVTSAPVTPAALAAASAAPAPAATPAAPAAPAAAPAAPVAPAPAAPLPAPKKPAPKKPKDESPVATPEPLSAPVIVSSPSYRNPRNGAGQAFQYQDRNDGQWYVTTDLFAAKQAGLRWEPIWAWFVDGAYHHTLDGAELRKYGL